MDDYVKPVALHSLNLAHKRQSTLEQMALIPKHLRTLLGSCSWEELRSQASRARRNSKALSAGYSKSLSMCIPSTGISATAPFPLLTRCPACTTRFPTTCAGKARSHPDECGELTRHGPKDLDRNSRTPSSHLSRWKRQRARWHGRRR
ncbi:hypothetical protein FA13DRAFT_1302201 [Coprinellus micaceus]|uniref:Uncharacterized protein n=1 Tax=Coprinellus micaceus TaxID=71717 RepID=A0A4Y7R669_COPMI|nr:hypothetical protein FA13DRAFT_1302201 [Coprinellus micaceus]